MTVYPRTYEEATAMGEHLNAPKDWTPMVLQLRGYSASGVFISPYDLLVTNDGTDTYASNAYQIVYGGPDDVGGVDGGDFVAVAQAAVTGGGYIVFFGDFRADDTLLVPSDTTIELIGSWTLEDDADKHLLQNSDTSGGNENIEVFGGVWNGNKANQPELTPENAVFMTYFQNVSGLKIHDLTAHDFLSDGMHVRTSCNHVQVYNIRAYDNGENGVFFTQASNIRLANIEASGCVAGNGLMLGTTADALPVTNVTATNIITYDNSANGVLILNAENISVDCVSYSNGDCGVAISTATHIKLKGIVHHNNYGCVTDTTEDITLDLESHDNTVIGLQLGQGDAPTEVNNVNVRGDYYLNGNSGIAAMYGEDMNFDANSHDNVYNGLSLSAVDGFCVKGNYTDNGSAGDWTLKNGVCLYPATVNQNGLISCVAKNNGNDGIYIADNSVNIAVVGAVTSGNSAYGIVSDEATTVEIASSWNNDVWVT